MTSAHTVEFVADVAPVVACGDLSDPDEQQRQLKAPRTYARGRE